MGTEVRAITEIARLAPLSRRRPDVLADMLHLMGEGRPNYHVRLLKAGSRPGSPLSRSLPPDLSTLTMISICGALRRAIHGQVKPGQGGLATTLAHVTCQEELTGWLEKSLASHSVRHKLMDVFFHSDADLGSYFDTGLKMWLATWLVGFQVLLHPEAEQLTCPNFAEMAADRIYLEMKRDVQHMRRDPSEPLSPYKYQDLLQELEGCSNFEPVIVKELFKHINSSVIHAHPRLKSFTFSSGFPFISHPLDMAETSLIASACIEKMTKLTSLDLGTIANNQLLKAVGESCHHLKRFSFGGILPTDEGLALMCSSSGVDSFPGVFEVKNPLCQSLAHLDVQATRVSEKGIAIALWNLPGLRKISCKTNIIEEALECLRNFHGEEEWSTPLAIFDISIKHWESGSRLNAEEIWKKVAFSDEDHVKFLARNFPNLRRFELRGRYWILKQYAPQDDFLKRMVDKSVWDNLRNLTELSLYNVSGKELHMILDASFAHQLKTLSLNNQEIFYPFNFQRSDGDHESVIDLRKLGNQCPNLIGLSLKACNLSFSNETISTFLQNLKKLDLTALQTHSKESVMKFICQCKNLNHLSIYYDSGRRTEPRSPLDLLSDQDLIEIAEKNQLGNLETFVASISHNLNGFLTLTVNSILLLVNRCPFLEQIGNLDCWTLKKEDYYQLQTIGWTRARLFNDDSVEELVFFDDK